MAITYVTKFMSGYSLLLPSLYPLQTILRIGDKLKTISTDDCWLWAGSTNHYGYGRFIQDRKSLQAHRVMYEVLVGEIPKGLVIDHLCRVLLCVNPEHLEPVTDKVNVLRGIGITAQQARQTHCKRNHKLSGDNIRADKGHDRICIKCEKIRSLARSKKNK